MESGHKKEGTKPCFSGPPKSPAKAGNSDFLGKRRHDEISAVPSKARDKLMKSMPTTTKMPCFSDPFFLSVQRWVPSCLTQGPSELGIPNCND